MHDHSAPARKRGRPRAFEEGLALAQMQAVFRAKGFDAASLDDLCEACGLNRPSIYATFGDKEHLYLKALRAYAEETCARARDGLAAPGPIEERLSATFAATLADFTAGPAPAGCMLATAATAERPAVRAAARDARAALHTVFEDAFAACARRRDLPPEPTPALRAQLAMAIRDSLAARARLGEPAGALQTLAQDSIALICKI